MTLGPVQVLVVGFSQPAFSGQVLAEFDRLRGAGVVRLVDVLLVSRDADGEIETLPVPDGFDPGLGAIVADLLAGGPDAGPRDDPGSWSLADVVPTGATAAVALIEHLWAGPLAAAIQRAGGTALDETWLAAEDRVALEALLGR